MRKIFSGICRRMLNIRNVSNMALSSSIGVLIGMLPLIGVRTITILLVSLIFRLNIILVMVGLLLTIAFPAVHLLTSLVYQKIGHYEIPFYTLRFLYAPDSLNFTQSEKVNIISTIIAGIFVSLVLYPVFYNIYKRYISKNATKGLNKKLYIFQDNTGKRLSSVKVGINILLITILLAGTVFGVSIAVNPFLPDIGLKNIQNLGQINPMYIKHATNTLQKTSKAVKKKPALQVNNVFKTGSDFDNSDKKILAFYVSWDDESLKSLKDNHGLINIIAPDWYTINDKLQVINHIQPDVDNYIKSNNIEEIPLVNNYNNNKWDSDIVHNLVNIKNRKKIIDSIVNELKVHEYAGINLDIENIKSTDKELYASFIKDLYVELRKNKLELILDLPASDDGLDYKALSQNCSYIVLMTYDEHYEGGEPGPVASFKWSSEILNSAAIPPEKLLNGIGSYGYDWTIGSKQAAETVGFEDVIQYASSENISIDWDKDSQNPFISYKKDGLAHEIWFLDGTTFSNQAKATIDRGAAGIAVWRLGGEDPTIWKVIKNIKDKNEITKGIEEVNCSSNVKYTGDGEILYIESGGKDGRRSVTIDSKGYVNDVKYISMPSIFQVKRFGKPQGKVLALTFDDGPDPYYTPRILDILKKYDIKATFFVVGENAESNPDILQRIYKEGHDIGNHTFTHPNISEVSQGRTKMELNATQRLIQEITGHSTILFRPPYVADAEPSTPNELIPILRAQELGYVMVGELIDPLDWQSPKPEELSKRILDNVNKGNIILLHDSGGNRDSTLKVLPSLIENLKKQGYTFESISQLMNKKREEVMSPVKINDRQYIASDKALFGVFYGWENIANMLFYTAGILGILRLAMLIYLSKIHKNKNSIRFKNTLEQEVSVVIAAYNEEKVICKTIDSVLRSSFDKTEIIIVDDGSTDKTLDILRKRYDRNSKIKILTKENGGKTSALNLGFMNASNDIIVSIDADTILDKDAITHMVNHFSNPKVAAVSGNIKVGNLNNFLTKWQYLEYVTSFNLEKRSFAVLQCITVVPGAIGAWRKSAVENCGYFCGDTLAEDTDMTLQLLKRGYKIKLEERAKAYTEAPENVKSLIKQRDRWSYGILQCLWKHKDMLFNPKYKTLGFIAMPNMWVFQYIFLTMSPIADLYFIVGLFTKSLNKLLIFYVFYFVIDLISTLYALNLEKERKVSILWLLLQRVIYRILMAYVTGKSIITAIKGKVVGWNKLKRTGSVA